MADALPSPSPPPPGPPPTAPASESVVRRLQHGFERLSLPVQLGVAGGGATLLLATAAGSLHGGPAAVLGVLAAGVAATGLCAALAQRTAAGLMNAARAARELARAESMPDLTVPLSTVTAEMQQATVAVRRAFDAARQREQALAAKAAALGVQLEHRRQELSTLQDLSIDLAKGGDIEKLIGDALGALEHTLNYSSASVWARTDLQPGNPVVLMGCRSADEDPQVLRGLLGGRLSRSNLQRYEQVEREARPIVENRPRSSLFSWLWELVTDDARTSALYRATKAWMAVPLKVRDEVLGVLRVDHHEVDYFDDERTRLLDAVGSQAALAMRHAHLLARERDVAVITERNRIARELHDAVSQTLFAANLIASAVVRATEGAAQVQAEALERLNRSALAEMRMLMFELKPDSLEGMRLPDLLQQAIEALAGRGGVEIMQSISRDDDGLPSAERIQLYRIAQEALSNIGRHSGATRAEIEWAVLRPATCGCASPTTATASTPHEAHPGHFGLDNMNSRAAELGTTLSVRSAPGEGTELVIELQKD
jgi:signal transduction histidine kinase